MKNRLFGSGYGWIGILRCSLFLMMFSSYVFSAEHPQMDGLSKSKKFSRNIDACGCATDFISSNLPGTSKFQRTVSSSSSSYVIQPGSEGKDTCYGTVYATSGQPDAETLDIGGWGDWYYDFFEFDLTGSPSVDETVSATFYIYGAAPYDGSDPAFQIYRITESWTESGVTKTDNPASEYYKDFGSFAVSETVTWNSVDITDLYKNWKNGEYPNYGIKLVPTNNNHSNGSIYSSDNTDSTHRPKIEIVYTNANATPTPTPTSNHFTLTESLITGISSDEFYGEYDGCKTPPEKTSFYDTDSHAMVWFNYKNANVNDSFKWEWYTPDNDLYTEVSDTATYTNGCWYHSIYINGYSAARKPGNWTVKVYRNDGLIFTETFTIISTDTTAPSGSISINSGSSYTKTTSVTLSLSATDDTGVTGYYVSTSSTTPSSSDASWVSVSSTTSYSASVSYTLNSGDGSKTVYVWYKDAAGNVSSVASDFITLDTTTPTVSISSPTTDAAYSVTSSTISLSGSSSDSTSDVSSVAWSNSSTGSSGTASGTTSWSVSNISLSEGSNSITVTATDNAGNTATDSITVTYSIPQPSPTPTPVINPPTVTTGSATNVTENSATLNGTANANNSSATVWFEYGTTGGVYSLLSSTQTISGSGDTSISIAISGLSAGTTYYYRIAGQNSAGTTYGDGKSFTTASSCTDDYEPNEDFQNAYGPLESGKSYDGKLCSSEDKDYFKFELENPNTIQLTLTIPSGNDYDLYLYDSSETEISNSRTTEQTEIITHNAISTGIYYIQVFGYGGAYDEDQPYTLAGTWTASLAPTPTLTPIPTSVASPVPNPTGTPAATGVIIGSVIDNDTRRGISGATVATDIGGYSATTDSRGSYRITVDAGSYTVTASADGYESSSQTVTVEENAIAPLNFSLTPVVERGIIFGSVEDEYGDPFQGVEVTLSGDGYSEETETDEDGDYAFYDVHAGEYTLMFTAKGYGTEELTISIEEGETYEVETVEMEPEDDGLGLIYGFVYDKDGDPIESAKVKIKGVETRESDKEYTDGDGFFEFDDMESGTYKVSAKKKGYKKSKETITLKSGQEKYVEMELRKSSKSRSDNEKTDTIVDTGIGL